MDVCKYLDSYELLIRGIGDNHKFHVNFQMDWLGLVCHIVNETHKPINLKAVFVL